MVIAYELYKAGRVRLPIFRKAFETFKRRRQASFAEQRDGVVGILVEIGIEHSLIHNVRLATDIEQHPSQGSEALTGKIVRVGFYRFLYRVVVRA